MGKIGDQPDPEFPIAIILAIDHHEKKKKNMKTTLRGNIMIILLATLFITACGNGINKPDVRNINVKIETIRFEKDFFALDTNDLDAGFESLRIKYGNFVYDFTGKILGLDGVDTAAWEPAIKKFLHDYRPIFDSSKALDKAVEEQATAIRKGLQFVKYYFPQYKLPEQFITFIGPMDAFALSETGGFGDIITTFALASGLQLHLGSQSSIYTNNEAQLMFPEYISRKFTPEYIHVNGMKNIVDDIHPPLQPGKSLLEIMTDHGKRMYLLDLFLPDTQEELKLGYTANQLKGIKEAEGYIWNFFLENKLLYETDGLKIRSFVTDGPSTVEFGIGSPGFISLYMGRQIIRAYMDKHPETALKDLLKMEGAEILKGSAYKPK